MSPDRLFPIPTVPVLAATRVRHDDAKHEVAWLEPRAARRWRPVYFECVDLLEALRAALQIHEDVLRGTNTIAETRGTNTGTERST